MELVPELLLAAVTVLSPLLSAIAIQSKMSPKTKNAVAFGVSILLAVGYLLMTGGVTDWTDVPTVVLAVYGLQQLVYKQFLTELSKKVEAVTSVKPGEAIVIEENKPNEVVETGKDSADVVIVDPAADQVVDDGNAVEPNYVARHRGDVPLG